MSNQGKRKGIDRMMVDEEEGGTRVSSESSHQTSNYRPADERDEAALAKKLARKVRKDGRVLVQKGSLTEGELLVEKNRFKAMSRDDMTEDERREEKRAANRLSAFQSRQRRRIITDKLQQTVDQLSKDLSKERKLRYEIKQQLDEALRENDELKRKLGASQAAAAQVTPATPIAPSAILSQGQPPVPGLSQVLSSVVSSNSSPTGFQAGNHQQQVLALLEELSSIQAVRAQLLLNGQPHAAPAPAVAPPSPPTPIASTPLPSAIAQVIPQAPIAPVLAQAPFAPSLPQAPIAPVLAPAPALNHMAPTSSTTPVQPNIHPPPQPPLTLSAAAVPAVDSAQFQQLLALLQGYQQLGGVAGFTHPPA